MADIYVTTQGDTWDSIAYDQYGSEEYMQLLIEANWPLLDVLVFSSGTEIVLPDLPEEIDTDLPFWRTEDTDEGEDDDDTDVETDEDVEPDDDDDEDDDDDDEPEDDDDEDDEGEDEEE